MLASWLLLRCAPDYHPIDLIVSLHRQQHSEGKSTKVVRDLVTQQTEQHSFDPRRYRLLDHYIAGRSMERLPNELLLYLTSFLEVSDTLAIQATSRHLRRIARDNQLWKHLCFENSRAEERRRRQQLRSGQDGPLAELRRAFEESTSHRVTTLAGYPAPSAPRASTAEERQTATMRALASWDPAYPTENVNFYQEFVQRHAPAWLSWFRDEAAEGEATVPECIGMGLLNDHDHSNRQKVLAPLEDGSICIYDLGSTTYDRSHSRPKLQHQTASGLLFQKDSSGRSPSPSPTNETEATDNLSIDYPNRKAYIAISDHLATLDLNTLQVTHRQPFPFPITALSAAHPSLPLTVGTNHTLHLHDPRSPFPHTSPDSHTSTRCEQIGGTQPYSHSHATLSQPGPLSLLYDINPSSSASNSPSLWVAGRFTSLLQYDLRTWPRISSTLFSGARLSALALLPYPYIPRSLDLTRNPNASMHDLHALKTGAGSTLIAAGEYKGKGSLELYDLPSSSTTNAATSPPVQRQGVGGDTHYANRQTASKSRLLSVTPHGTRLVFSDGDGNLKWVERDGSSVVRGFNINTDGPARVPPADGSADGLADWSGEGDGSVVQIHRPRATLFVEQDGGGASDIVRKVVPRVTGGGVASGDSRLKHDDLLLWTGDGRLGVLGFGKRGVDDGALHAAAEDAEEAAKQRQERQYERRMREALERQADETRFVRGLGEAYGFGP